MTSQETVSAVLDAELRRRGLTQTDLARGMGRSKQGLSHKFRNYRPWSLEDLDTISAHLGIPVAWLLMPPTADTQKYQRLQRSDLRLAA